MYIPLPTPLKNLTYRYILVQERSKKPIEPHWNTKNNYPYTHPKIQRHLASGGNVGVLGGYGGLVIIDFDDLEYQTSKLPLLPPTFSVRTGTGKLHLYYHCTPCKSWKVTMPDGRTLVDIQGEGKQALTIPSTHPNGNQYMVYKDLPIETITLQALEYVFADRMKQRKNKNAANDVFVEKVKSANPLLDVLSLYGYDLSRNPTMCGLGHDSVSKSCFSYNAGEGLWHCFHCNKGGDVFSLVQAHDGVSFGQARDKLAARANLGKGEGALPDLPPCLIMIEGKDGNITYKVDEWATAHHILNKTPLINIPELQEIYYYDLPSGTYQPGGETFIGQQIHSLLGEHGKIKHQKEIVNHIKNGTVTPKERLNSKSGYVNVNNGVIKLDTKELLPHNPNYYFTNVIPVDYDPDATCPLIQAFIEQTLHAEDIPAFYEMVGYCFLPHQKLKRAFMFTSPADHGKTVIITLLTTFFGKKNTSAVSIQRIASDRWALAQMYGKIANLVGELTDASVEDNDNFKTITGNDSVTIENKYKSPHSAPISTKMIYSCNSVPRLKKEDPAALQRWHIFNCPNYVPKSQQDIHIDDKLASGKELSGLLNLALEGMQRLLANKEFTNSLDAEGRAMRYLRMSDVVANFVTDCVRIVPGERIAKSVLYNHFSVYCKRMKIPVIGKSAFGRRLVEKVRCGDGKNDGVRLWYGIDLLPEAWELLGKPPDVTEGLDAQGMVLKFIRSEKMVGVERLEEGFAGVDVERVLVALASKGLVYEVRAGVWGIL